MKDIKSLFITIDSPDAKSVRNVRIQGLLFDAAMNMQGVLDETYLPTDSRMQSILIEFWKIVDAMVAEKKLSR